MLTQPGTFDETPSLDGGTESRDFFGSTLLEIWREACRHIEIDQSTAAISPLLQRHLPLGQLLIRRVDLAERVIETVAVGLPIPEHLLPEERTICSTEQIEHLRALSGRAEVRHFCHRAVSQAEDSFLVPAGLEGDVLAGPLGNRDNPAGVLVLIAPPGQHFNEEHRRVVRAVLEPFSTALENDGRLRELAAMRAAAEADRTSLLTRLGRKGLTDSVVGADSGLHGVMERVDLVAPSDVPVLILGETGTGKELIARLIHTHSRRSAGPFLRVNCGAIPMELIDSHLFGHEKGAFTGAVESRQGWFERADGGTLLLDEIGELPLAAQVRLLRILQDGWLERVGGATPIHVDVRVVAATHRDLNSMAMEGGFREDLWYRIAVFPILLPPLRERRQDIADLARHFAERAAVRFTLPLVLPTEDDIQLLQSYAWPGNIRELGAVIDRAAILGNGKRLEVANALGSGTSHLTAFAPVDAAPPRTTGRPALDEIRSLDEAMKQHIETALAATRGRIEGPRGTAAVLKINPHTLRARMKKLGIDWARFREED